MFRVWLAGIAGMFAASTCLGGLAGELDDRDLAKVKNGQQVVVTENVPGFPWPRATVYQKIQATPAEVMAVFVDYDNAKRFVPNCKKSEISRRISATVHEVDYEIAVPMLKNEIYTARNELSGKSCTRLAVDWEVLRASSIKSSKGNFVVEPFGAGSLVRYQNLVEPSTQAAALLRSLAIGQMRDTVQAISTQIAEQKTRPDELAHQVRSLRRALGEPHDVGP